VGRHAGTLAARGGADLGRNLFTWRCGLPSSSAHALIGGLVGAALVQSGSSGVQWSGLWHKVIVPGAVSPVIGFAVAFALLVVISGCCTGSPAAGLTIAAGTYAGGWRIIRTLGQRIYKMPPEHGFAAQIAAGTTLYAGTRLGFRSRRRTSSRARCRGRPVVSRPSAGAAGTIVFAWLLTLPAAALVAAALYYPVGWIF
jgi:PiT family inorganic phosphate transporter